MHVVDETRYAALLRIFRECGPGDFQVITDFDETLTAFTGHDGTKGLRCHEIILRYMDRSEAGLQEELAPLQEWHDMSEAQRMDLCEGSFAERKKRSQWWFKTFQEVSSKFKLCEQVGSCVAQSNTQVRAGLSETFRTLSEFNIPLLVVSAGLKQFITSVLEKNRACLPEHAELISNDMTSAEVQVTSRNKADIPATLARKHFRDAAAAGRRNILVLGDKPADCAVVDNGFEDCQVMRIGFMKGSPSAPGRAEEAQPDYLKHFDVVLTDDAPMNSVNEILASICGRRGE